MKKICIVTSVENSNLKRNRNLIKDAISTFEGKTVNLTLELFRKKRSNSQNAYYHGVVIPLVQSGLKDATGEIRGREAIHYNILLPMFAPTRDIVNKETGEMISEKITSSEMSISEFMDFIISIQRWAAEFLNIVIPDPNQELQMEFD